jgi:caffeoyl-CoA O-methyltransferase
MEAELSDRLVEYVRGRFAQEDEVLAELRAEIPRHGMPEINISPDLGRLLQVLLRSIDARSVLEIGTLGGYSALWMARALPPAPEGRLITLELDGERADFARRYVGRAGLESVIDVRVGDARELLEGMVERERGEFDVAFIDADKASYVDYLERSLELVRPGGLILADNAFRGGLVLEDDPDPATAGILAYNERIARDDRLVSTIIPIRDGLAVSVVRG